MRNKKRHLHVVLAALLACSQMVGCAGGSSEGESLENPFTKGQEEETSTSAADTEDTSTEAEETEGTKETKETEGTSSGDETKESGRPAGTDPEQNIAQKYFELMGMELADAREYFEVEEDSSLTPEDFDEFMESVFVDSITGDRLTLDQYLKDAAAYGIENISSITYDPGHLIFSEEEKEQANGINEDELKEMLAYPYEELSERQKLVFDKMYYEYLIALWGGEVPDYSSQLGLTSGLIPNLAVTFYEYIFDSEENVKTYARVMDYLPELILEVPELVNKQIEELGYAPTDYMLDTALDAIEELMETEDNPFIDGYNAKIETLNLGPTTNRKYEEANEQFYIDEVIPALEKAYDELEALYGTNPTGQGLCYYEGGLDYYEYVVEDAVGGNMSIDELMTLLDDRMSANVKKLIRYATFNSDAVDQYYDGVISYPGNNNAADILTYFVQSMSRDFPQYEGSSWMVSELPKSLEIDGILAYYLIPRIDATDVNVIRVNASATADDPTTLFMTLAHEGYPGHMLQFNVQQSCGAYSVEQLLSHLGYSEGWAMYAEYKSLDYAEISEALKNIILIDSCINYDLCAYIDLAVNGKGWGVDEIGDYLEASGFEASLAEYLLDLSVGDPGALLPYSVGYILTDEVIEEYVEDTGADYKEAYEAFMSIGTAPFSVVKKYMGTEF